MKKLGCIRNMPLLSRRFEGLSAAEALRLEEHLASCAHCGRQAATLDGMRELVASAPGSLPPVVREQVIRRAFAQAEALPAEGSRLQALWPAAVISAAAMAAAAATFAFLPRGWLVESERVQGGAVEHRAQPLAKAATIATASDRVLSGAVETAGREITEDGALDSVTLLRATEHATVSLAHARVQMRPGTALRWNRDARTLRVNSGSIVADVDPGARQSFTVQTARFTVLVLGTRFEVLPDAVFVERGHVRVLAPDGTMLAESLGAGEQLVVPADLGRTDGAEPPAETSTDARRGKTTRKRTRAVSARAETERLATPATPAADGAALLAQARSQLARHQIAQARKSLDAALAVTRDPQQRAEAMSLRAECALVGGDLTAAVEAYLRVARAYANLPAGQNALFAAARLESERGRSAAAAGLLERYLARYPRGRFVKEARTRLRELGAVLDHEP